MNIGYIPNKSILPNVNIVNSVSTVYIVITNRNNNRHRAFNTIFKLRPLVVQTIIVKTLSSTNNRNLIFQTLSTVAVVESILTIYDFVAIIQIDKQNTPLLMKDYILGVSFQS